MPPRERARRGLDLFPVTSNRDQGGGQGGGRGGR
jgi:hypothetical protein